MTRLVAIDVDGTLLDSRGQVPAIKAGALVATKDQKVGLTMSSPTPLSIPYMTQLFVPLIAAAADKADAA